MFSILDNIKSLFFPKSNKRKLSDPIEELNNLDRIQKGVNGIYRSNNSRYVYKDTHQSMFHLPKRRRLIETHTVPSSKSDIGISPKGDALYHGTNDISYESNCNSSNNSICDEKSIYYDCQLSNVSMVERKRDLLDSDYLNKILQPGINKFREREKIRLELESKSNTEQLRKQEKSYMNELTDKLRQLWSYAPVIFPRYVKKQPLPKITEEMLETIKEMTYLQDGSEIIVRAFNLEVNVNDLCSLEPTQWLTDNVINFYLELIYDRSQKNNRLSKIQILSSFFYPKLVSSGYNGVRRWTKKRPIFDCSILLIPIHLGNHWCLVSVDFDNKEVFYYDSLQSIDYQCLNLIKDFLIKDCEDKLRTMFEVDEWTFSQIFDGPRQYNSYDCGVFLCQTAEYISRRVELDFNQDQMEYFRQKMSYEIIIQSLL